MKKVYMRSCVWLLVLLLMIPVGGFSQDAESAPPVFRQEELDQMLAPIALYPDSLLIQMLMASTYPLEVVQAQRWASSNPNLKDEKLAAALDQKGWDPSVKSLVNFPTVLAMMNDNLEWTQNLGDAFLGQKDQMMATIQDLRAKAHAQGNLKTTREQVVVVQDKSIVIEPASPQVIYVPAYNPIVVFGPWWYPAYPPRYFYPPGYAAITPGIITFGVGLTLGVAWGYAWGNVNWARHQVYVNPVQNVSINRFPPRNIPPGHPTGPGEWRHDPVHRKGVAYKDPRVQQTFGHPGTSGATVRKDFTGPGAVPGGSHKNTGSSAGAGGGSHPNTGANLQKNTGPGAGPSGGSHKNTGSGAGAGGGSHPNTGANLQKNTGPGAGPSGGSHKNTGPGAGTGGGSHPNTGANLQKNTGPGAGPSGGSHKNTGPGAGTGGGSHPNTGANLQKNTGPGAGPSGGSHKNTGPGAGTGGGSHPNTGGSGKHPPVGGEPHQ